MWLKGGISVVVPGCARATIHWMIRGPWAIPCSVPLSRAGLCGFMRLWQAVVVVACAPLLASSTVSALRKSRPSVESCCAIQGPFQLAQSK